MPNNTPKNNLLFDFYQNIKSGTEVLSIEDLEVAIKTMELAKEELKINEQKRISESELNANKELPNGKVLYLPKNQKTIYADVFRGNEEIVKVVLNEGLKEIGEYAFAGCINLREVVFPNNRLILRRGCFKDCISLKEIHISEVSNICPSAFENCTSLEKVFIPNSVSNIYGKAFKNCNALKEVTFEGSWHYYRYCAMFSRAFENCFSLESIELPYNCGISDNTFLNCRNLKTIYIHTDWRFKRKLEKCSAEIINLDAPK